MKVQKLTIKDFDYIVKYLPKAAAQECLRQIRATECFAIADRAAWYDGLTDAQKKEVQAWRAAWLDVTETFVLPVKPNWI